MEAINNQKFNKLSEDKLSKIMGGMETSIVSGGREVYQTRLDTLERDNEISRVRKTKEKAIAPPGESCYHPDLFYYKGRELVLKEYYISIVLCD